MFITKGFRSQYIYSTCNIYSTNRSHRLLYLYFLQCTQHSKTVHIHMCYRKHYCLHCKELYFELLTLIIILRPIHITGNHQDCLAAKLLMENSPRLIFSSKVSLLCILGIHIDEALYNLGTDIEIQSLLKTPL